MCLRAAVSLLVSDSNDPMRGASVAGTIRIFATFAAVHSLLASPQAKGLAQRLVGARYRNGLHRALYNLQSVVLFAWAILRFLRLPDRELYRIPPPWSWLLHAGQAASVAILFAQLWVTGLGRTTGVTQLLTLLGGGMPRPETEAQGSPPGRDGEMVRRGPFRASRHPANAAAIGMVLCFPRMTVNLATVAALTLIYAVLGSCHEEARLRRAYGTPYERYRRTAPFLVPVPRLAVVHGAETGGLPAGGSYLAGFGSFLSARDGLHRVQRACLAGRMMCHG